ncbi:MAG: hypothetical protein KME13_09510 [Myxacorys californica WJT36-NPBG1]|nr:hypothetical protein [Myxacorys californica WJT36-NPBG1]
MAIRFAKLRRIAAMQSWMSAVQDTPETKDLIHLALNRLKQLRRTVLGAVVKARVLMAQPQLTIVP